MKTITVLLAALALTSIGCTKTIDGAKLEKHIAEELEKQAKVKPKSVTCPKDQVEKEGGTFACSASLDDGTNIPIEVKMKGGGNVEWETKSGPKAAEH
jgi:hypothetical protein